MKLTNAQLRAIKDAALERWKDSSDLENQDKDAFLASCWINGMNDVLGRERLELYAFDTNYNERIVDPSKFIDVSGKIQIE